MGSNKRSKTGERKHQKLPIFYQSRVALFSDTFNSDIAPYAFILPVVRKRYFNCFKVYLGHGTIAFKKMPSMSRMQKHINKRVFNSYDLASASTRLEVTAMRSYGVKDKAIRLVGSARHDQLRSVGHGPKFYTGGANLASLVEQTQKFEGLLF